MEKSYPTRLVNDTKTPLMVYEADGPLVEIAPGQEFVVESRNPATMYARWSEVRWKADGGVSFVTRPAFTEPERGRWLLRLLNRDGAAVETRVVGGRPLLLPKGVPVVVGLRLDDPLVRFKSLTIVRKRVPVKDEEHSGYLTFETIIKDELEERDGGELKALEAFKHE